MNYEVLKSNKGVLAFFRITEKEVSPAFWLCFTFDMMNFSFRILAVFIGKETILETLKSAVPLFCEVGGYIQFFNYVIEHRAFFGLVNVMQNHYDSHKHNPKDFAIIKRCYQEADRIFKICNFFVSLTGCSFISMPLIVNCYRYMRFEEITHNLPYETVYPWDCRKYHVISYVLQAVMMVSVLLKFSIIVGTSITVLMSIVAQLQLTQERFKEMADSEDKEGSFIIALHSHQDSLHFADAVKEMESKKLFAQVFASSIALGLSLLMLSMNLEPAEYVLFSLLSCALIAQAFTICYYGQKTINESLVLYQTIYELPWYDYPRPLQKSLCFCMMRSSRNITLTALGFANISLETFKSIATTAYTYLTFMGTAINHNN